VRFTVYRFFLNLKPFTLDLGPLFAKKIRLGVNTAIFISGGAMPLVGPDGLEAEIVFKYLFDAFFKILIIGQGFNHGSMKHFLEGQTVS
jgi:hypothetical protein